MRRRDEQVQPIRLGGASALPLSFETEELVATLAAAAPERIENWREVLEAGGFEPDEVTFLEAVHLDQVAQSDVHEHLENWSRAKTDKTRKAIAAKLKTGLAMPGVEIRRSGGSSIHLTFEEQVRPGLAVWTFATVTRSEAFREELARARAKSLSVTDLPRNRNLSPYLRRRILNRQLNEVREKLQAERQKLAGIIGKSEVVDDDIRTARGQLAGLREKVREGEEAAILDGVEFAPDPSLSKQIKAAEKHLEELESRRGAFSGATAKQQQAISKLQGELGARRHEAFVGELNGTASDLRKLIEQVADRAGECLEIARKHGADGLDLALALYPPHPDGITGSTARDVRLGMVNAGLLVASTRPPKGA